MCGLAGMIGSDRDMVRDAVQRMTRALRHRGPDAEGVEVHAFGRGWLGLGHRRLSILDLSPLGHQPMGHGPSGCRITFNGEIYNFPRLKRDLEARGEMVRSGSDTEVLLAGLARHGEAYTRQLEGMYAFAFFDPRGPRLVLARDPAGIKPLYVARAGDALLFASEIRAILASGLMARSVSPAGVAGLLAYGAVPQPLTLLDAIRMNPPGSWQVVTPAENGSGAWSAAAPTVWWEPPEPDTDPPAGDLVPRTRDILDAAVRDHLIADVPVGLFLSAGLDSAAIAGLAARHSKEVRAFTVGFADQPDFDELGIAAETAKRHGLPHTPIQIPNHEAEEAARQWLAAADQPSMDGLNVFVIAKAVRAHGIKVALCGLGADELFGGYPSFREVPMVRRLARAVGWMPRAARRGLAGVLTVRQPAAVRHKLADMLGGTGRVATLALQRRRVLSDRQLAGLGLHPVQVGLSANFLPPEAERLLPSAGSDPGWAISVVESRFYQTNVLLRDSDADGMAHGLEIRVPFLDQRLLDWMHRQPGEVRFPAGRAPKHLLRAAAADLLCPELLDRPKTGFTLPLRRWMVGPLRRLCEEGLAVLKACGLVRPDGVDAIWQQFLAKPESQAWSRALSLCVLGDYLRRHAA
jgi:asparagine synthase (glutamine-hydrolysing)